MNMPEEHFLDGQLVEEGLAYSTGWYKGQDDQKQEQDSKQLLLSSSCLEFLPALLSIYGGLQPASHFFADWFWSVFYHSRKLF